VTPLSVVSPQGTSTSTHSRESSDLIATPQGLGNTNVPSTHLPLLSSTGNQSDDPLLGTRGNGNFSSTIQGGFNFEASPSTSAYPVTGSVSESLHPPPVKEVDYFAVCSVGDPSESSVSVVVVVCGGM
jgi:hypothetical protein